MHLKRRASWKRRKKKSNRISSSKSALSQSPKSLKKVTSWKRRKKKQSLVASLEFSQNGKGSSLRKVRSWKRKKKMCLFKCSLDSWNLSPLRSLAWKRRKKKSRCSKRFFKEFNWDPGGHFQGESRRASSSFPVFSCCLVFICPSSSSLSLFFAKGEGMQQVDFSMETVGFLKDAVEEHFQRTCRTLNENVIFSWMFVYNVL